MSLSEEQVRWVAHLARLELKPDEVAAFSRQLSQILAYVEQLKQAPTDAVEPLAHALDLANVFRDDALAADRSLAPEAALANAPRRQGPYFSVPAVLEG